MKKILGMLVSMLMLFCLNGCSASADDGTAEEQGSKILVAYFSASGHTKQVAEQLAAATGADLFEIVPTEPYGEKDLNYRDDCRANREQQDSSARPQIANQVKNMARYEVVLLGYPIWWGQEPRIMDTFMESYDFSGKTMATFCTSGSSDINTSSEQLKALAPQAEWLPGRRFASADAQAVEAWAKELPLGME